MIELDLIDAHAHLFPAVNGLVKAGPTRGLGHGRIAVGPEVQRLTPDLGEETRYDPETLVGEMTTAGVTAAVLLQGTFYGECNAFAAAAVRRHPGRLVAQAYLDPWQAGWEKRLEDLLSAGWYQGIKIEFSESTGLCGVHPGSRLDEPALEPLWRRLARERRVLTLDLGSVGSAGYQTDAVARLADDHPDLTIVICHLGQPNPAVLGNPAARCQWEAQLRLGERANVCFDTASLPAYFRAEGDPYPGCREVLRRAVDLIGPERILWGSDVPGALNLCPYQRYLDLARRHTDFLSGAAQNLVLGGNARRIYFHQEPPARGTTAA